MRCKMSEAKIITMSVYCICINSCTHSRQRRPFYIPTESAWVHMTLEKVKIPVGKVILIA